MVETVQSNYLNPDIYCKEKELAKKIKAVKVKWRRPIAFLSALQLKNLKRWLTSRNSSLKLARRCQSVTDNLLAESTNKSSESRNSTTLNQGSFSHFPPSLRTQSSLPHVSLIDLGGKNLNTKLLILSSSSSLLISCPVIVSSLFIRL